MPVKGAVSAKSPVKTANSALLQKTNQKENRAKKNKLKFTLEEARPDVLDTLRDQLTGNMDETLLSKMFSTEFKAHLEAIQELSTNGLANYSEEIVDWLDVILKWCAYRLSDSNVSVLKAVLEFAQALLNNLVQSSYALSDYEANCFLPMLIEKSGFNNETIRGLMKSVISTIPSAFPVSKMCVFLMEGLKSKNSKTKVECMEHLAELIKKHGINIIIPNKALPQLAEYISEKDTNVRNAAIGIMLSTYEHIRDDLWKIIPNIPESSKAAIQDKLKYLKLSEPAAKIAKTPLKPSETMIKPSETIHRPSQAAPAIEDSLDSVYKLSDDMMDLNSMPNIEIPYLEPTYTGHHDNLVESVFSQTDFILDNIHSRDPARVIEALKVLCLNEDDQLFALHSDKLCQELTKQLRVAFHSDPISLRVYKYILNAMHKMYSRPLVAKALSFESLKSLLLELIAQMTDPKASGLQDGQYLLRALNLLIVNLLDNVDKTNSFTVLLKSMETCVPWSPQYNQDQKFRELVMKSLLKVTKSLHNDIDSIHIDLILRDIHAFLEAYPSARWKTYSEDMPLRTIKTVLSEFVSLKGPSITNHLSLVPLTTPPPAIVSYINLMIHHNNPKPKATAEAKAMLTEIFKKIGTKDSTRNGLYDLYQFKKDHPSVDVQPYLAKCSEQFQEYIKTGLGSIENQYSSTENRGDFLNFLFVEDPNTPTRPSTGTDRFAVSSMDRLRQLQNQYGIKTETGQQQPIPSVEPTVSVDSLKLSIARLKNNPEEAAQPQQSVAADLFAEEVNALSQSRADNSASTASVASLRQRLAAIKHHM